MDKSTLGELLPKSQHSLISSTVASLTKDELENAINDVAGSDLTVKELASLRRLALARVNAGETPYTWSTHNFNTDDVGDQDPNTCSCW